MSTTLIPPLYTKPYGVAEVHAVLFQHRSDRGGMAHTVTVMIPEAESNIKIALAQARSLRARVLLVCDTAAQAKAMRNRGRKLLPHHREVAIDRADRVRRHAESWRAVSRALVTEEVACPRP